MFAHTVQPPLLTLLNSSAIPALSPLWTAHADPDLPEDSTICLVTDDEPPSSGNWNPIIQRSSTPRPLKQHLTDVLATPTLIPRRTAVGSLAQPVIHVQSPTIRTTYIQCGSPPQRLGIELPWLGIHLRRLGAREVVLEVGVVDTQGNEARLRFSSFQATPTVRFSESNSPVLHIPLKFPTDAPLTPWLELQLNLPSLIPLFHTLPLPPGNPPRRRLPKQYASTTHIRIYANCRIKRIWMSSRGDAVERAGEAVKDEWGMYSRRL